MSSFTGSRLCGISNLCLDAHKCRSCYGSRDHVTKGFQTIVHLSARHVSTQCRTFGRQQWAAAGALGESGNQRCPLLKQQSGHSIVVPPSASKSKPSGDVPVLWVESRELFRTPQEVDVAIAADLGTLQRLPTIVGHGEPDFGSIHHCFLLCLPPCPGPWCTMCHCWRTTPHPSSAIVSFCRFSSHP